MQFTKARNTGPGTKGDTPVVRSFNIIYFENRNNQ